MVLGKASNYFGQCKAEGNGRAFVSLKYALGTAQTPAELCLFMTYS